MDFTLGDTQRAFAEVVTEAVRACGGRTAAREAAEQDWTSSATLWDLAVKGGWTSVLVAEQDGGGGGSLLDLMAACEVAGRSVLPIPLGWHAAVARELAGVTGVEPDLVAGIQPADLALPLPGLTGTPLTEVGGLVSGTVTAVAAAQPAHWLVAGCSDGSLAVVRSTGSERVPTLDTGRPLVRHVVPEQVPVALVAGAADRAARAVVVATAAEFVGALDALIELGVEYAKNREQFGKPIGSFQAVQHLLVDCLVDVEPARSLLYYAAYADGAQLSDNERWKAARAAYIRACEALRDGGERVIQVFGGMGFTWEHDAHLLWRRALGAPSVTGPVAAYLEGYTVAPSA